jgi:dienelactone hydrolase
LQREQVYFESDGLTLAGYLYLPLGQPPYPAVIVCHDLINRKENHVEFARFLQERGFAALALNFQGYGESRALFLTQCQDDEITPYQNSQRLYELAGQPKKLLLLVRR